MKIMWIGNIILPQIAEAEGKAKPVVGGWLVHLADIVAEKADTKLVYLFDDKEPMSGVTKNNIGYYSLQIDRKSPKKLGKKYISQAKEILCKERPDVVHIWGTEQPHALAFVEACEQLGMVDRVIISIQGMLSEYAKYYSVNLPLQVVYGYRPKDILKGNIQSQIKEFQIKGGYEREAISKVKHIIGRTDWDRACTWVINPNAEYHSNNETLREEFYTDQWRYDSCEKHSIFCSQAHYPIKGLHLMLEALQVVKIKYPDVKLYIGGRDYSSKKSYTLSSYEHHIMRLIKKYNLTNNIVFCGFLNAADMKQRYLMSNVFVSPSTIENSPNSVGEAMLLGCPVISSRVGGTHNMLDHGKEGYLYPSTDTSQLAYYIDKVFSQKGKAEEMGENARLHAMKTHDSNTNFTELIAIYEKVVKGL